MSEWVKVARKIVDDIDVDFGDWDGYGVAPKVWNEKELIKTISEALGAAYRAGQHDMQRRAVEVAKQEETFYAGHAGNFDAGARKVSGSIASTISSLPIEDQT